jgi:selenocysteine-specific elongation factor
VRVVATAGHVDHGKSSLVRALTGTDPDRFPEEKARGLTIDLGFAFFDLPSGLTVGFVDVPGHVKFVKNMLAGVGAIDVALLVVAANEGWMPQTEEHVRILELLGVEHGMIALTKAGLVDADGLELARLELDERIGTTALARWPVVVVDSVTGEGVADVVTTLAAVLAAAPAPFDEGRPRLWVDRAFTARGAGTVVTGTLTGGALTVDNEIVVEPGGRRGRVRGIESHHEQLTRALPGSRVALNLAGVEHRDVARGSAVVRAGDWPRVDVLDVELHLLADERLARRSTLDVHAGSGQHRATVRVLDDAATYARVWFEHALPLAPGDRLVLRSSARQTTVGGAVVVDVAPANRVADALDRLPLPTAQRLLAARPWLTVDDARTLAGTTPSVAWSLVDDLVGDGRAVRAGEWAVERGTYLRACDAARAEVARHHRAHPGAPGIDADALARALGIDRARLRALVGTVDDLVVERDVVREAAHRGGVEQEDGRRLLAALEAAPFAPPTPAEVGVEATVAKALVRDGAAVEVDGVLFASRALDEAERLVVEALRDRGALTIGDVRDLFRSSRKFVVPLVNRLDAQGVTRRRGDVRVAGPRAGPAAG